MMHIDINPVKGLNTGMPSLDHNAMSLMLPQGLYRRLRGHNWELVIIKPLGSIYGVSHWKQLSADSFI